MSCMIWLQMSSFLFSTITIHAYSKGSTDIFVYSLFLTLFNLWYYCTYNAYLKHISQFVSLYYFFYTELTLIVQNNPLCLTIIIFATTLYNLHIAYSPELKLKWHIILHFHTIACSHFYLL